MKRLVTVPCVMLALLVIVALALGIPASGLAAPPSPPAADNLGNVPTPSDFLKMPIGADRVVADYTEISAYFQEVGRVSPRVKVENIGQTEMGKPLYMAIVSHPSTIQTLDAYADIQWKLAHPEGLNAKEVEQLLGKAKPVVVINAAIHSTEIASTQMLLNLLYKMASGKDARTTEILDNVILILIPTVNPDGHQMTVDWYEKYLGTQWEGTGTPWLYGKYAGHDDNRDWYMFNLSETRAIGAQLYEKWFPQMLYDVHQMGNRGPRLFVPPYTDPFNPEIDPLILRSIGMLGGHIASDLQAKGLKGVSTNSQYDAWKGGAMRDHVYYHNVVGILTEGASVNIASPITQTKADLTSIPIGLTSVTEPTTAFPDPWLGGEWHMSDLMNYEETTSWSLLTLAARYKDKIMRDFYDMGMRGIEKGKTEAPSAYVIPLDQKDPAAAAKLVDTLVFQDVQVHQATEAFTADGKSYPAGSYVILTAQPTRANVKLLMGIQNYPDIRNPDGSPQRPYDVAGWTVWMTMGVNAVEIEKPFNAKLVDVTTVKYPEGTVASGDASYGYAFGAEMNNATTARVKLLQAGYELDWAMAALTAGGQSFAPGATIVKAKTGLSDSLKALAKESGVNFFPVASAPSVATKKLSLPRVAVYESWVGNADIGWGRFILENFGVPFTTIYDADIRAGNLNSRFDVILFADISKGNIEKGRNAGSYPPEYTGGITAAGVANVKTFVENGGTLVTMNASNQFTIDNLGVPVKNVLAGVKSSDFYCPGSVLEANVDNSNPMAFGMGTSSYIYFVSSPAFEITGPGAKAVISYGATNPLRSGWLLGPEKLANKVAAAEAQVGNGKALMIGFNDHFRSQAYGTFKLMFNSIFYSAAK